MFITVSCCTGCKKFLEEKSDKKLVVPSTMNALQALLDNYNFMNTKFSAAGETSADDYYLTGADYTALPSIFNKRMYTWEKDNLFDIGYNGNDWSSCYKAIYIATSVLDNLQKIERSNEWNNLKGQALVFRASRYLDAVQTWSVPYDEQTRSKDLGLPLRLDPDFNGKSERVSVEQTYNQIITDLQSSISLLPIKPLSQTRPSKAAAYGLLSRTFLAMGQYANAGLYADSCLQLHNALLDYNILNASASFPIKDGNIEVIFYQAMSTPDVLNASRAKISLTLVQSYDSNDLRNKIFFKANSDGSFTFKGNYTGSSGRFTGITSDEMLLNRSECFARSGNISEAINDLNLLLSKRWKTGTFVPFKTTDKQYALQLILTERRKELLMRGLRWFDIRRLNKDGANIKLSRQINGQDYTLIPNSIRFALPLPEDVITLSGMQQNPR